MAQITKNKLINQYLKNLKDALEQNPANVYVWIAAIEHLINIKRTNHDQKKRNTPTKKK